MPLVLVGDMEDRVYGNRCSKLSIPLSNGFLALAFLEINECLPNVLLGSKLFLLRQII